MENMQIGRKEAGKSKRKILVIAKKLEIVKSAKKNTSAKERVCSLWASAMDGRRRRRRRSDRLELEVQAQGIDVRGWRQGKSKAERDQTLTRWLG